MKPAFSVIFFTVSSGAGFGLIALLVLADLAGIGNRLPGGTLVAGGVIALVLVALGLISSTLHLANPKNAWRAFSRFRTSWLSREGVFSLAFFPCAIVYLALAYFDASGASRAIFGAATLALAWVTLYCTGMIYASLKPIPQWHTPLVPVAYFVLGHYSGALLFVALLAHARLADATMLRWALAWLALAAGVKAAYYVWLRRPGVASTINTATGITRARVRLLDAGHSHGTFLTDEFGFVLARQHALAIKAGVFALAFALPLAIFVAAPDSSASAFVALASALLGLVLERWIFFAEARHVVRLYHGL